MVKSRLPLLLLLPIFVLAIFLFVGLFWFPIKSSAYPPPPPNSEKSNLLLPAKVHESLKSIIGISARAWLQDTIGQSGRYNHRKSNGTGFMVEPGIFLTARHILMTLLPNMPRYRVSLLFDKSGVPTSNDLGYSLFGTSNINDKSVDFPLTVVGMGNLSKNQDYMALKATDHPQELQILELDDKILNLGDMVYISGYVPLVINLDYYSEIEFLFDVIKKGYPGIVDAINTKDFLGSQVGVSVIYRLETKFELGFSGGPVFNSEGKVVALTILHNNNHVYAISAKDIKLFINNLKSKGAIPKN